MSDYQGKRFKASQIPDPSKPGAAHAAQQGRASSPQQPRAPRPPMHCGGPRPSGGQRPPMHSGPRPAGGRPQSRPAPQPAQPSAEPSFEGKLKQFMSVSDSKQSELNRYMSGKRGGGRRRK